jgi:hypothetical protein
MGHLLKLCCSAKGEEVVKAVTVDSVPILLHSDIFFFEV